jgi:hypothetical protein
MPIKVTVKLTLEIEDNRLRRFLYHALDYNFDVEHHQSHLEMVRRLNKVLEYTKLLKCELDRTPIETEFGTTAETLLEALSHRY